jgi:hypothetical protein
MEIEDLYECGKDLGLTMEDINNIFTFKKNKSVDFSGDIYKIGNKYGTTSLKELYKDGSWYGTVSIKDFYK